MKAINKATNYSKMATVLFVLMTFQYSVAQISSPTNMPLTFGKYDGNTFTEYLRIDTSNGNLGIGYENPTEKLEVNGYGKFRYLDSDNFIKIGHGGNNSFLDFYGAGNLNFRYADHTEMTLTSTGRLGIGTSSPTEKLEVRGNMRVRGLQVTGDGDNTNTIDSKINGTIVFGGEDGSTLTNQSIADSFYPEFSVWVEDGIVTEDIAIAPNDEWGSSQPDYVFEDSYNLPSLGEIEAFIKENKHLEGIPSKAEVTERGWSLPEMDQKLLKKVEELMLYTIEQDKQIKTLKKQMELLLNLVEKK